MFNDLINHCTNDFNGQIQDENNYGFGWTKYNESYQPPFGYSSIYNSFQFKDETKLQGSPIDGEFNTYPGHGYVYEMRGQLSYLQGNLSLLREMNWVDRQTRAIFIEFSVYNPNINLVMVSRILLEIVSSGSILSHQARFDTLNLFGDISLSFSFKFIAEILFIIFIVYFIIMQIIEIINMGSLKEYIKDFWFTIEWSIIITAFISVIMFALRFNEAKKVLSFFKNTGGYGYMKLQKVNDYNQILTYCLGLCASLGIIKSLKMLRFNQNISILGITLKQCFGELSSFSFLFFIVWIAFVQVFYLIFNVHLNGYSSLTKSMGTAFCVMMGKFDVTPYTLASPVLGPLIFSLYNIVILFFALNIFISIIIESFDKVINFFLYSQILKSFQKTYSNIIIGKNGC